MHRLLLCFIGLISISLGACSTNPATGRQEFTPFLPASQEKQVGAEQHRAVVNEFGGIYENSKLTSYVNRVTQKIAAASELPVDYYNVYILNSSQVNAFALPGGYIYLTRGLIAIANTEAELAGVIGHEIGHVTARHAANRSTIQAITGLGAMFAGVLTGSQQAAQLAQLGGQWYSSSYSQDQEYESDMLGVRYLAKAGYNPYGQADFLRSLRIYSQYQKEISNQQNSTPSFFSTHPDTASRVTRASNLAGQANIQRGVIGRDTHLAAIKNMVWGDDPSQGVIQGQKFVHPDLKFSFSVPNDYRLINQSDAVYAQGPNNSLVKFDADFNASGRSPIEYIQYEFLEGAPISSVQSFSANGLKGSTALTTVNANGRRLNARLFAFQVSQKRYYRFMMAAPQNVFNNVQSDFYTVARSLKRLSDSQANNIKPYKLAIRTLRSSDTMPSLARYIPDTNQKEPLLRVLNGFDKREKLPRKGYIKVISK